MSLLDAKSKDGTPDDERSKEETQRASSTDNMIPVSTGDDAVEEANDEREVDNSDKTSTSADKHDKDISNIGNTSSQSLDMFNGDQCMNNRENGDNALDSMVQQPTEHVSPDDNGTIANLDQKTSLPPFGSTDFTVPFPPPRTKAVLPKYVVRPGPVPPPPKYVLTEFGSHHALDHLVWMHVFHYLSRADLAGCMRVCKTWNRWCLECRLWRSINLQSVRISQNHLIGTVRRQPRTLNLRDSIISQKQLVWLIARLPHLKELVLYNNTWAAVCGLCSSICPLLEKLDLSWVDGVWDDCIRDLVSPPSDHRPGVDESVSRLRRCSRLSLVGTNITDQAMEVIAEYMPRLTHLDISFCPAITGAALQFLAEDNALTKHSLVDLKLSYLNRLDDDCFSILAALPNLQSIDLSNCPLITPEGCEKFLEITKERKYIIRRDLKSNLRIHTLQVEQS